jgi:CDP-diacylglycerol--serine O-phosphatidyltransferase
MTNTVPLPARLAALFVYSRPVLIFGGMICALAVMWGENPVVYTVGVSLLMLSMIVDLVDGWFSARFRPNAPLAPLADRLMDKLVYSIIFPVIAAGMMWRLLVSADRPHPRPAAACDFCSGALRNGAGAGQLCVLHARICHPPGGRAGKQRIQPHADHRGRTGQRAALRIRVLYPEGPESWIYFRISYLGNVSLRILFFVEILFFIINLGSIAGYCRKYGTACLDELCFGDQVLRRKILSVFPNALTVMNALMGLIAVFFAYQGRMREAYLMLIGAATFDKLDGALARRLGLTEPLPDEPPKKKINMGSIMDDLADAISFCMVPAWIFYIT